jgi:hypothetical protein
MRKLVVFAVPLLLALPAAKPVPPGDAPIVGPVETYDGWRGEAVGACIETLHAIPELSPDDLEAICGCAAGRIIESNGRAPLPTVERGRIPAMMRGPLMTCTARTRPEQAGAVMRLAMNAPQIQTPPPAPAPPPLEAKPVDEADAAPPAESESGGFGDWVRSLSLPDWLTGASALLWVALGILVFGLLALKVRRRDPRNDLLGPPSSMRRGAPPQRPRRPDLPR